MDVPPFVKKHQILIVGGVVAVVLVGYILLNGSSSSSATTTNASVDPNTGVPYAVEQQSQQEADAASNAAAQTAVQAQQESDAATLATNQLNASINATQQTTEVDAVQALGSAISTINASNAAIPVAAINAAENQNQAALLGAAQVAANADAAVPGVIQGAGSVLAAANAPSYALYNSLSNSAGVQAINSLGSNLASSEQASTSVSNSATNAAVAQHNSNNQTAGEIGTIAAIALL